ncbi:MAG: hypothetical protein ACYTAF_15690, partial [Planctomycetota bacterium]
PPKEEEEVSLSAALRGGGSVPVPPRPGAAPAPEPPKAEPPPPKSDKEEDGPSLKQILSGAGYHGADEDHPLRVVNPATGRTTEGESSVKEALGLTAPKTAFEARETDHEGKKYDPEKPWMADVPEEPKPEEFVPTMAKAFKYPLSSGSGIAFLIFMTIVITVLFSVPAPGILGFMMIPGIIMMLGYAAAYMWKIMRESGIGRDKAPHVPDLTCFTDVIVDFFRFVTANIISYLPFLIWLGYGLVQNPGFAMTPVFQVVFWVLLAAGTAYYPMALMLIGFFHSAWAPINYAFGARIISRIPKHYTVTVLYFVGTTMGLGALEWQVTVHVKNFGMFVLSLFFIMFCQIYLYMIQMRVLGVLFRCNQKKLQLFEE